MRSILTMFKKIGLVSLMVLVLLSMGGSVFSQPEPMERREQIKDRIQTLRIWKMIEFLDLNREQSDRFLPLLNHFQKVQRDLDEERKELIRDLAEEVKEKKMDQGKLGDILNRLEENRKILEEKRREFVFRSKEILSIEQQAKLIVFEEKFAEKLKEILREIKEKPGLRRFR